MSHSTEALFVRIRRTAFGDLLVGLLAALAIDYVVLAVETNVFLTTALTLPFFLFIPGYTVLAALFPSKGSTARVATLRGPREMRATGIDVAERLVLSYGVSIALLPIVGVALDATPLGITRTSVFGALTLVVALAAPIAVLRRSALPEDRQFRLPVGRWTEELGAWATRGTAVDSVLNVVLAVSVVAAVGMVGFAVVSPPAGAEYTQASLLTESESGTLVAGSTPDTVTVGEEIPLVLQVENRGTGSQSYSTVVQLQRVSESGAVTDRRQLDRFGERVGSGSTWQHEHSVAVPVAGERLRVTYLVYEGEPPTNPTRANAEQTLYFWVDATDA